MALALVLRSIRMQYQSILLQVGIQMNRVLSASWERKQQVPNTNSPYTQTHRLEYILFIFQFSLFFSLSLLVYSFDIRFDYPHSETRSKSMFNLSAFLFSVRFFLLSPVGLLSCLPFDSIISRLFLNKSCTSPLYTRCIHIVQPGTKLIRISLPQVKSGDVKKTRGEWEEMWKTQLIDCNENIRTGETC